MLRKKGRKRMVKVILLCVAGYFAYQYIDVQSGRSEINFSLTPKGKEKVRELRSNIKEI